MTSPSQPTGGSAADDCAQLRATVEQLCAEARSAQTAHEQATERIRELRRELTSAQHAQTESIAAADPAMRAAEKAATRDTYRMATATTEDEDAQREATASYGKAIDRINRSAAKAKRAVQQAKAAVDGLEAALPEAERAEQTTRLHADQVEAACLDARVRLATCEEGLAAPEDAEHATALEPHAATGGHAVAISESGSGQPLVIESMVSGDRLALELAAARMAEHTGHSPAESQLQLQELVDAIVSAASHDGYLTFASDHPFWSTLTFEEARDVVAALARLGFVFEPSEGWHSGRAPAPSDLSMALAYAGLDPRNMRDLPTADDLQELPASIGVDARAFLAARAPDLTIDHVVHSLDRRASGLEALWNEWGQVRPILLSDRHALGSIPG